MNIKIKYIRLLIVLFIVTSFLNLSLKSAKASTIFSESLQGPSGQIWNPSFFNFQSGNKAVYNSDGIIGTSNNDNYYTYRTTNLDNDIKWTVILNGNYQGIVSCRDSNDVSSEERAIFNGNGTVNLQWFHSGGGTNGPGASIPLIGSHTFELICISNIITLKEDGATLLSANTNWDNSQIMQAIRLDLNDTSTTITSYQLCDSSGCSISISPTPSTSPTPTPIPDSHLNVPLLKQTANPWQSQIYDSAKSWAKSNFTINAWGCFITDAAMIFQYFGIQKMPDGSPVNPGTINTWLRSQKDGYVGNGYVNPLALQNLSKLIKLAFNNPSYTADALEYKLSNGANTNLVAQNLLSNIPSILAEPGSVGVGHYVVATGKTGSTFTINDPFYNRTLLTDGYNNTFLFSQRYVPSHTDLSYILLVGPQNVDFTVTDASGSAVGEEITQGPLQNPNDPSETNGAPIKMFFLEQPSDGSYTITVTSNIAYAAKAYLYDQSGNVQIMDLKGSGTLANPDVFTLLFTKADSHQDSVKKVSIFDQLTNDILQLYQQNLIKKGNSKDLLEEVNEAKNQYNKQHFLQEKVKLAELLIKLIVWDSNHTVSHTAYQTLVGDITYLLTH